MFVRCISSFGVNLVKMHLVRVCNAYLIKDKAVTRCTYDRDGFCLLKSIRRCLTTYFCRQLNLLIELVSASELCDAPGHYNYSREDKGYTKCLPHVQLELFFKF